MGQTRAGRSSSWIRMPASLAGAVANACRRWMPCFSAPPAPAATRRKASGAAMNSAAANAAAAAQRWCFIGVSAFLLVCLLLHLLVVGLPWSSPLAGPHATTQAQWVGAGSFARESTQLAAPQLQRQARASLLRGLVAPSSIADTVESDAGLAASVTAPVTPSLGSPSSSDPAPLPLQPVPEAENMLFIVSSVTRPNVDYVSPLLASIFTSRRRRAAACACCCTTPIHRSVAAPRAGSLPFLPAWRCTVPPLLPWRSSPLSTLTRARTSTTTPRTAFAGGQRWPRIWSAC